MQLKLKGRGVRLRVESTISDFENLVSICTSIALKNNVQVDMASIRNMAALGLETGEAPIADLQNMEKIN